MTIRKFVQNGQGYGADAVEIRAKIDGVTVFEGAVPTVDQPLPSDLIDISEPIGNIFEWQSTVEFSGTAALEIEVLAGGALLVADTAADHVDPADSATIGSFYTDEAGTSDPFSAVAINGVPVLAPIRDLDSERILKGQWHQRLNIGDVLTALITISAGRVPKPAADPVAPA